MVALVNYATNFLERPTVVELLGSDFFRHFNKTEFSIERHFKKFIILVNVFRLGAADRFAAELVSAEGFLEIDLWQV